MKLFLTLIVFLILGSVTSFASDDASNSDAIKPSKACFVDLDGDGINDNARDMDDDGIPDTFGAEASAIPSETEGMFAPSISIDWNASGFGAGQAEVEAKEPNSGRFSAIRFSARDLGACRGGLKAGDGLGIGESGGVNAGGGGMVCEGGVCRPR
ncbi:MAG: hypothetical protein ABIK83_05795 [Candidatus Zixiibacteriota bacterium]